VTNATGLRAAAIAGCLAIVAAACGSTVITPPPSAVGDVSATTPRTPPVTAPPPTPVGSTVDATPCGPPDLTVDVSGHGATGSILLVIRVTNGGSAPCALVGPPTSIGLRAGGGTLPFAYVARPDPWPGDTPTVIAPPVVLAPGAVALARAIWTNWCLGPADVSTVWVGIMSASIDANPQPTITPARCDNDSGKSTVEAYPFEVDPEGG
jgi:hypothetical protein